MDKNKRLLYNDKAIKFLLGHIEVNILNINYEPPVSKRYFTPHSHSSYELHYVPTGEGILKVNHKTYKIVPGTFYLTGPGVFHEQIADEMNPMSEFCLNFEFRRRKKASVTGYYNKEEIDSIALLLEKNSFWFGEDKFNACSFFERIFSELDGYSLGHYSSLQNLASQIILYSVRCFVTGISESYTIPNKVSYERRRTIIDDYFRHYDKSINPTQLAENLSVSVRQLDRIMKTYYSMSFKQKLLDTRVKIASELLKETHLSIQEISDYVGFSNTSHFYKTFVKIQKETPSKHRGT